MGSIAINQILSLGLTLEENVNVIYEIMWCNFRKDGGDICDFTFNSFGWVTFFRNNMK